MGSRSDPPVTISRRGEMHLHRPCIADDARPSRPALLIIVINKGRSIPNSAHAWIHCIALHCIARSVPCLSTRWRSSSFSVRTMASAASFTQQDRKLTDRSPPTIALSLSVSGTGTGCCSSTSLQRMRQSSKFVLQQHWTPNSWQSMFKNATLRWRRPDHSTSIHYCIFVSWVLTARAN